MPLNLVYPHIRLLSSRTAAAIAGIGIILSLMCFRIATREYRVEVGVCARRDKK